MTKIIKTTAEEAKNMLKDKSAVLIDVREPAEHRAESISEAINIPLSKISAETLKDHNVLNKNILIHCKSGKRSQEACEKLTKDINADLYNLHHGIEGWTQAGFDTQKSSSNILPLDRQVQLVVSIMILSGLILNLLGLPLGLILSLMAGLGLLNAAITGWCGMAKLLAIMPWNQ